ncbi:MAG: nucleotide exchange factor GrpE [Defluviitaleaceae bacterium]|nr:nucleotide exchange factor GrpE [Defluviitaleaceae bacterium]
MTEKELPLNVPEEIIESDAVEIDEIIDIVEAKDIEEPQETSQYTTEPESATHINTPLPAELARIESQVAALGDLFTSRILRTEYDEKVIDNMHTELQRLKTDLYSKLIRPIIMDLIQMRTSIIDISEAYSKKDPEEQVIPLKMFKGFADEVLEILDRNGVEQYKAVLLEEEFIPLKHRIMDKIKTDDESLNKKIAISHSDGYIFSDKVISAEKVTVYTYDPTIEPQKTQEDEKNG